MNSRLYLSVHLLRRYRSIFSPPHSGDLERLEFQISVLRYCARVRTGAFRDKYGLIYRISGVLRAI